jgi:hypothetical protein
MARLQEVLEEASAREAYELVMESGQPVVLTTSQGPETLGDALAEGELIDALTDVLDDEQQVELAVGNLIEFHIETAAGRWTLISEPVADGVIVRGRLRASKGAAASGEGGALDLPPLDPFSPSPTGEPLAAPGAGDDAGRASRPTVQDVPVDFGGPAPEPKKRHGSGELDVEVSVDLDGPATGDTLFSGGGAPPPPSPALAPPPASGPPPPTAPSFDDLGFGAPLPPESGTDDSTLFNPAGGPAPVPAMGPAESLDVSSAADLGFGAPDPAPRPQEQHGTLIMGSDAPRPDEESLGIPDDDDDASFSELSMELDEEPPSFPPPPAPGSSAEGLATLAGSIEPGTLCFVHGHGVAEELAGHIGVPIAVVEDGPDVTGTLQSLLENHAEPGTVVVRMEDPSAQLGFLLRRLEEGWRVLVETRARTAEGARRILLGVGATAVAEAWLDAQVTSWAMAEAGHWKLL